MRSYENKRVRIFFAAKIGAVGPRLTYEFVLTVIVTGLGRHVAFLLLLVEWAVEYRKLVVLSSLRDRLFEFLDL